MRHFVIILCLLSPCLSLAAESSDKTEWQEIKKAEGIQLYSSSVAGTTILKVKAVAVIDADINSIKAVIDDVAHHPGWLPYLIETRVLDQISATESLFYSRFDASWPARDRDAVYRVRVIQREDGSIVYQQQSQQSSLMPAQDDYVRATLMQSSYSLMPVAGNRTRVELLLHADPHGKLPMWIVNIVQQKLPFESLRGLIKQVEEGQEVLSAD